MLHPALAHFLLLFDSELLLQSCLDFGSQCCGVVGCFGSNMQDWQSGCSIDSVDKFIAFLSVRSIVRFVIQFDRQNWLHCLRLAQQEVDVFSVDAISETLLLIRSSLNVNHICQIGFHANVQLAADRLQQDLKERILTLAQDLRFRSVRQVRQVRVRLCGSFPFC